MRSLVLSQCRDLRIGVTTEDLGALTTVRALNPIWFGNYAPLSVDYEYTLLLKPFNL